MSVIELTTFVVAPDRTSDMLSARSGMLSAFRKDRRGFIGARLVRVADDTWLDVVEWADALAFDESRAKGATSPRSPRSSPRSTGSSAPTAGCATTTRPMAPEPCGPSPTDPGRPRSESSTSPRARVPSPSWSWCTADGGRPCSTAGRSYRWPRTSWRAATPSGTWSTAGSVNPAVGGRGRSTTWPRPWTPSPTSTRRSTRAEYWWSDTRRAGTWPHGSPTDPPCRTAFPARIPGSGPSQWCRWPACWTWSTPTRWHSATA